MNFLSELKKALRHAYAMCNRAKMITREKLAFTMAYVDIDDYPDLETAYRAAIEADKRAREQLKIDFERIEAIADV